MHLAYKWVVALRGLPYKTSALEVEGSRSPKGDKRNKVARIMFVTGRG